MKIKKLRDGNFQSLKWWDKLFKIDAIWGMFLIAIIKVIVKVLF